MALDNSILVELPEHGIAYKKVCAKTYVYYVTATYRNKNGNPTCTVPRSGDRTRQAES